MKYVSVLCALCLGWLLMVSNAGAEGTVNIRVSGSSTIAPLLTDIGARFEQKYPGFRVDVQAGGSSRGIADIRNGISDIGMVSRSPKVEERKKFYWVPIAKDVVGMVVHRDNPVQKLTPDQISKIYRGELRNWQDVAKYDGEIVVVHKAAGRSTLEVFLQHFQLKNTDIRASTIIGDNQQGIKVVAGNPLAIGYVSIGAARVAIEQGDALRVVPLASDLVSAANNSASSIGRVLHIVTQGPPKGDVKRFVEFIRSSDALAVIEGYNFAPLAQ